MKDKIVHFVEAYLYKASPIYKIISLVLLPLSFIYCAVVYLRYLLLSPKDFQIPIISIGNLVLGGSGKTPLVTELANHYENVAIILRGYGRESSGMIIVRDRESILCDVHASGDEAMIYAQKVLNSIVIVSENREIGILKAKELGAKIVFLDDAYRHHQIKKLDILIDVSSSNSFCLPSGPYREKLWSNKEAVVLHEAEDFFRETTLINESDSMVLVTAISQPQRLDKFLPQNVIEKYYFSDHYFFNKDELSQIMKNSGAKSILCTYKDYVKIKDFGFDISLLDLKLSVDSSLFENIDRYIQKCN